MIQRKKSLDKRMMGMRKSLTLGALLTIFQGGTVVDPVFQLLKLRHHSHLSPSFSPSRSLMLTDGMYCNQHQQFGRPAFQPTIILSRYPYDMVTDRILDKFCILKFKRFECISEDIAGSLHKGILVHEVEILFQGSEVGQEIFRNTTAINGIDGSVSENDQKAAKRMAEEQ